MDYMLHGCISVWQSKGEFGPFVLIWLTKNLTTLDYRLTGHIDVNCLRFIIFWLVVLMCNVVSVLQCITSQRYAIYSMCKNVIGCQIWLIDIKENVYYLQKWSQRPMSYKWMIIIIWKAFQWSESTATFNCSFMRSLASVDIVIANDLLHSVPSSKMPYCQSHRNELDTYHVI